MGCAFSRAPSSHEEPPCTSEELLGAALRGDVAALQALLPRASSEALSVTKPLSLYHAAAVAGSAEMVRLLAAAGVPVAAAEHAVAYDGWGWPLDWACLPGVQLPALRYYPFKGSGLTAMALAALLGHADAVSALLDAGLHPDSGGFALDAVMFSAERKMSSSDQLMAVLRKLLAAGADATPSCRRIQFVAHWRPEAARLLLSSLQQACAGGAIHLPHVQEWLRDLAAAACMTDAEAAFEYFAGSLPAAEAADYARTYLSIAARAGSVKLLRLALQAATVPEDQRVTVTAQLLGPALEGAVAEVMQAALEYKQPAVVQLLLEFGHTVTIEDIRKAVRCRHAPSLQVLLQSGRPAVAATPLQEPLCCQRDCRELPFQYSCPVLAALETRKHGFKPVDWWDGRLVPVMELLLENGYQPTVYRDVLVCSSPGGEPTLQASFNPLTQDQWLDLDGKNRWLKLTIDHPAWSPGTHHRFLPSFRAAVRTLLLALHRASHTAGGRPSLGSLMAGLPPDLLRHIIGLAAYPLSTWVALDAAIKLQAQERH